MKAKFTFVLVLFAVLMATLIYSNHMRQVRQASSVLASFGGMPVLERAASFIDMDKFEHLLRTLDPTDPFYIETQQKFVKIRDDSQCEYLYVLSPDQDGVHRYIFDTEGDTKAMSRSASLRTSAIMSIPTWLPMKPNSFRSATLSERLKPC